MERPTLSPSKVEKAREAIDFLSSLSLPPVRNRFSSESSSRRTGQIDVLPESGIVSSSGSSSRPAGSSDQNDGN